MTRTAENNELGELLDALDMADWLDAQNLDYKVTRGSSGIQLNVRECPVCGNGRWKVYLNASNGLGNCFAGDHPPGENFTKWRFIRAAIPDVSGRRVVESIKAHVESRGWRPKRLKAAETADASDWTLPASIELPYEGRNLAYLDNRGIDATLAAYFKLRFCTDGHFRYRLLGEWRFMGFANRILIPVFDLDGRMVTFQGRDITGEQEPKYLFPPGLSSSGTQLYNGQNVRDTKRIAVAEGVFDVFALKKALDEDEALRDVVPVGTFGKHLSYGPGDTQQGKFMALKARGVEEVTFFWDGEVRATDDALAAARKLRELGFRTRIAMLPKERDPNEVTAAVVRECFYKAIAIGTRLAEVEVMTRRRAMNG